jgi:hypothetical protein
MLVATNPPQVVKEPKVDGDTIEYFIQWTGWAEKHNQWISSDCIQAIKCKKSKYKPARAVAVAPQHMDFDEHLGALGQPLALEDEDAPAVAPATERMTAEQVNDYLRTQLESIDPQVGMLVIVLSRQNVFYRAKVNHACTPFTSV